MPGDGSLDGLGRVGWAGRGALPGFLLVGFPGRPPHRSRRRDLYVLAEILSLTAWMAFMEGTV